MEDFITLKLQNQSSQKSKYFRKAPNMNKVMENMYSLENGDKEALERIQEVLAKYPDRHRYRVESFISPQFVRISVYKMEF